MEKLPLQVSEAIALINQTLDYAYPVLVVEGEVASFKVNQGKFVFFDLKDNEGALGCFMMVFQLRQPLEDGMRVQVVATPKLTAWGKFSLTVREVRPVGEGSLKRAYELLRAKLDKEGLFAAERKRPLPDFPENIAVISSTAAAGYADFMRLVGERWGGVRLEVAQVQVQGDAATKQLIRALQFFNEREILPDVVAIIRGGGSADDLSVFNDEQLVRSIAASRIPTIVGVGHETDETLADLVADVRAATPSHAAQLIVPQRAEVAAQARHAVLRVASATESAVERQRISVRQDMNTLWRRLSEAIRTTHEGLQTQRQLLEAYDPSAVLARGYALLRGKATVGSIVEVETSRHVLQAEVQHVTEK